MNYASQLEQRLVEDGYDSLSLQEKNNLIALLANRRNLLFSDITTEYILNYHKDLKIQLLDEQCEDRIVSGITSTNGHRYRCNRDDQLNLLGKKYKLTDNPDITTVKWKTEDVGYIDHTREEWLTQVYGELYDHKESIILQYNQLKAQVTSAQSDLDVVNITWDDPTEPTTPTDPPTQP